MPPALPSTALASRTSLQSHLCAPGNLGLLHKCGMSPIPRVTRDKSCIYHPSPGTLTPLTLGPGRCWDFSPSCLLSFPAHSHGQSRESQEFRESPAGNAEIPSRMPGGILAPSSLGNVLLDSVCGWATLPGRKNPFFLDVARISQV